VRGVAGWLLQRISGAVLVAGLALHFYVMHFAGSGNLTYEAVRQRLDDPWWIAFNMAFLLSAVYHGFGGLWGICLEYARGAALKALQSLVLVSAAGLTIAGIYILAA
jgi:succinate dehydrogenase / fumarate reductase membrane anchor subunit